MDLTKEQLQMLDQIAKLPELLLSTVTRLSEEQLDTPIRVGAWTVRQVVHHLADSHMNSFVRLKMMLTEDNPELKPYNEKLWAEMADARSGEIDLSIAIVKGIHNRSMIFLNNLTEEEWKTTGFHPEHGKVTFTEYLDIYANHGESHLASVQNLIKENNW